MKINWKWVWRLATLAAAGVFAALLTDQLVTLVGWLAVVVLVAAAVCVEFAEWRVKHVEDRREREEWWRKKVESARAEAKGAYADGFHAGRGSAAHGREAGPAAQAVLHPQEDWDY